MNRHQSQMQAPLIRRVLKNHISACPRLAAEVHIDLKLRVDTFWFHFQLTTLGDLDRLLRLVSSTLWYILDLLDNIITLKHLAEDNVLSIKPRRDGSGDEELNHRLSVSSVEKCVADESRTWLPLVSFPEFAILRAPFLLCFNLKFSSGNLAP